MKYRYMLVIDTILWCYTKYMYMDRQWTYINTLLKTYNAPFIALPIYSIKIIWVILM